jgi:polyphosphate kinase
MAAHELRFSAADLATLERILTEPLPLNLRGDEVREEFFRDIYFDSPDEALHSRGVTCRFRISADDRRWLAVAFSGGKGVTPQPPVETDVGDAEASAALAGSSPAARRLQALTDPSRLAPRLELEIHRRIRAARRRFLPIAQLELIADTATLRSGDVSHMFREVILRSRAKRLVPLDRIGQALGERYGLRPLFVDRITRAEQALETLESAKLAEEFQQDREIAVLVVDEGRVALARQESDFRLPVKKGTGEAACRELLRSVLGSPEGKVAQIGLVRTTGTRPPLEVWVARRVRRAAADARLEWFAPSEVVARAGSPVLKDPRTLAALTVAGRSEGLPEWTTSDRPAQDAAPAPDVTAQRQSFISLAAVPLPKGARKQRHGTPDQFLNIQLGQLEFNQRVLALAEDPGVPLLARLRFLAIFSSNTDEFFMIRMGGLKRAVAVGKDKRSLDGLNPEEQLHALTIRIQALLERQRRCFHSMLERDLPRAGIAIRQWGDLQPEEQAELQDYFEVELLPLLTPKAITLAPGHPFPLIDSLSLSVAVMLKDPQTKRSHFVDLTLPSHVPQLVQVGQSRQFVPLEEIVRANAAEIHPGRVVEAAHAFRVTRLGDLELDETQAADLTHAIEEEVSRRGRAPVVRVELERGMPPTIRKRLDSELRAEDTGEHSILGEPDIHEADGLLNLGGLMDLAKVDAAELDYSPFTPADPFAGSAGSIFDVLDERDVLVHHPYDCFEASFERWLNEAADDPDVMAIKLTLYRPGRPSVISDALHRAAAAGKQVSVFVELKARFDEQQNIVWARKLERAGIHVVTGLVRYKTHAKIAMVVRRSQGRVKHYSHIGSGNYNRNTAKIYTDLGLFTSDDGIGRDLQALFNELTGSSRPPQADFRRLIVAPTNALSRFMGLIEREIEHAKAGRPARIRVKMNALVDAEVISALYRASQAGVEIDMIVRGMCALRPGVPGLSERIRVISILGRFLEHGRIFYFENGGEPEYFIGSADLRPRNLRHRVEVVTPVLDAAARAYMNRMLETEMDDPTAWVLNSDGSYERTLAPTGVELTSAQEQYMAWATEREAGHHSDV